MNFSILLKELRTEKAISQSELAKILGLTQDSISLWEKGKSIPATPYLIKLADFFGVSTDYLLGRSDDLGYVTVQSPAPSLSEEEMQLLELFGKMNRAQRIRTLAYCEGIIGISVPKFNA